MTVLEWRQRGDGVVFEAREGTQLVPIDRWALLDDLANAQGHSGRVSSLLALRDLGVADEEAGTALYVPWRNIAELSPIEIGHVGLPPASPFNLKVEKRGLISDESFSVSAVLTTTAGLPVVDASRTGALLVVGGRSFTILQPIFGVLCAVDGLASARTLDERAAWLGDLQEGLPAEATVDPYLRTIRIARSDSFTVLPQRSERGDVTFKVVPARSIVRKLAGPDGDEPNEPVRVLPEAHEDSWNRYLDRLQSDRRYWSVGGGHYLVVSDELRAALPVVAAIRSGTEPGRIAFLRNPRAVLRARLEESLGEEILEALFWESGEYGTRVREIGVWQPKVLPWIKRKGEQWLPEAMGLRIGDIALDLDPDSLVELRKTLLAAQSAGTSQVTFRGRAVPVTEESLRAVEDLLEETTGPEEPLADENPKRQRIAVLVEDNLEELKFRRPKREVDGGPGALPRRLGTELFPFQRDGYRWLQSLWSAGAPGALLADDMGLGKTVQALAFLSWVQEQQAATSQQRLPILIVGPTGLLRNWLAEHEKHLHEEGLGEPLELHGEMLRSLGLGGPRGSELSAGLPTLDVLRLQQADWVLTTYETMRDYQHSFAKVRWSVAVFDEAQRIKNPAALVTDAAKAIEAQFCLALTGTPVENHLADVWTIVDTAQPGRLGALKDFLRNYDCEGESSDTRLQRLKRELTEADTPPLMLRRMKEQCLTGLPEILMTVTRATMPPQQADAYDKVVALARQQQGNRGGMLSALHAMRAISLHPDSAFFGSDEQFVSASARLSQAVGVLDDIQRKGEKALVFVESLDMQAILAELLQRRYRLASPPPIINGGVAGHKRKGRVDEFSARPGFDVMILSPRAGGVGLTITEANHVIHLSRWWNPAVEDQATDRVYRIGQTKPVHVHVPMAVHPTYGDSSFDIRLESLLQRKRALSRGLLAPPTATADELARLYRETTGAGGADTQIQ